MWSGWRVHVVLLAAACGLATSCGSGGRSSGPGGSSGAGGSGGAGGLGGGALWEVTFPSSHTSTVSDLALASDGSVFVAGMYGGTPGAAEVPYEQGAQYTSLLARLSPDGQQI